MAYRRAPRAGFHVRNGLLARADAINPIAMMALGAPDVKVSFANWFFDDAFGFAGEHAAIDAELAQRAFKDAAAGTAVNHLHAARVEVAHPAGRIRIGGRNDLDRTEPGHAERPLRDVERVRA